VKEGEDSSEDVLERARPPNGPRGTLMLQNSFIVHSVTGFNPGVPNQIKLEAVSLLV